MPKGVEHRSWRARFSPPSPVRLSVMPKGVEHKKEWALDLRDSCVRLSVMPKGVEHPLMTRFDGDHQNRATFSDAERR